MSIKIICDACGKESGRGMNKFQYLCHLDDDKVKDFVGGYCDEDGNAISGREISVDLCNKCYNVIVIAAVDKMNELKKKNKR